MFSIVAPITPKVTKCRNQSDLVRLSFSTMPKCSWSTTRAHSARVQPWRTSFKGTERVANTHAPIWSHLRHQSIKTCWQVLSLKIGCCQFCLNCRGKSSNQKHPLNPYCDRNLARAEKGSFLMSLVTIRA